MVNQSDGPAKLRHPIVLVHGLGAMGTIGPVEYFHGIPKRLREAGNQVLVPNLTAWHTFDHRARQLLEAIEKAYPDQKVNLIGHSMGGLDARYLASKLDKDGLVASVTTVGTPNRGSALLDMVSPYVPVLTLNAINKALLALNCSGEAFKHLSKKAMAEIFEKEVPNAPGVAYFSATSIIPSPVFKHALPIFWLPHRVLKKLEGENDGFVTEESAKWGEHICTYYGDHYGQIGQLLGKSRGLDHHKFFQEIVARLAREGY